MGDNRAPILTYKIQYNTSFTPDTWETATGYDQDKNRFTGLEQKMKQQQREYFFGRKKILTSTVFGQFEAPPLTLSFPSTIFASYLLAMSLLGV